MDTLNTVVSRLFFAIAFVLLLTAMAEKIANATGFTILRESVAPSTLLNWAVTLLIFVMALLLRQIRERVRGA